MVKRISGNIPTKATGGAAGVKGGQEVKGSAGVDNVQKLGGVQSQNRVDKVRRQTRPMTEAERTHLLQLVDDEADKLFGDGKIPERKKESLTRGVKMTIAAGLIEVDDED